MLSSSDSLHSSQCIPPISHGTGVASYVLEPIPRMPQTAGHRGGGGFDQTVSGDRVPTVERDRYRVRDHPAGEFQRRGPPAGNRKRHYARVLA